jgi:two-component system CheB/CheR fusion protein
MRFGKQFPIVAIGASAGGLEAMARLLDAMPADTGIAFLLVQHLDPSHQSQLAELLTSHTTMPIREAEEGMGIEPDHVYVCPPGHYLGVRYGVLHLSLPHAGNHARLPIDFLIHSLAEECGSRSIGVILSGNGGDGSGALAALRKNGGHIVVQDPEEAEYDGMPRNAILTGLVNAVAPLAKIPAEIVKLGQLVGAAMPRSSAAAPGKDGADVEAIITLLQQKTGQDFSAYKRGTLERRIQRRMGLCGLPTHGFGRYEEILGESREECDLLAEDLLINVTSFFRDPAVFDLLEREITPELIGNLPADQALRVWVAGCSTGEEAYSIAMICRDAIMAARRDIKLQVFASDIDAEAIGTAREGVYPLSVKDDIPADRLARYFVMEDDGYRVTPGLRGSVVFTVQDVLHDPPFSRMDMVSCRNLLIYLKPDAQAKVISLFHFALREKGVLLLGLAETIGNSDGRFQVLHKAERLYRHVAQVRSGEPGFPLRFVESIPRLSAQDGRQQLSRQAQLADLCRDLVIDSFAPANMLINSQRHCIYSLGPVSRYLRVASGPPTLDLLAMVPPDLRATLRYAIGQANRDQPFAKTRVCQTVFEGEAIYFTIQVRFVTSEGEDFYLVSFVEEKASSPSAPNASDEHSRIQIRELERELEATHSELLKAVQSRDALALEQRAINDEALSVNEEFQSTNEELLTSKEELQSLNEELIALNSQLQETLDRQRVASDDLQNILYSTNVATLFLDPELCIRFFTPAARAFFNVIPGDLGRPLSDLHSLADDTDLLTDAQIVLRESNTIEREISAPGDLWFLRRIFPYRTQDERVAGVVITFIDITDRRRTATALEEARRKAERSSRGKSRFLAVASHDLRQPLQSLKLIQELLQQSVRDEKSVELIARFDQLLEAMSGMLNSLLDINQIEAGVMEKKVCAFPVASLFDRLETEFQSLADYQGLGLQVVPSGAILHTDPGLLEVMLRNLLANALKYTFKGRILMGCRLRGDALRIEVWDTGIGIAPDQLPRIFDEFHQVGNPAREREHGFGLGLTIVRELGQFLGHAVEVRSWPGKGSVFSVTVNRAAAQALPAPDASSNKAMVLAADSPSCAIVVVEDDPDVLDLLDRLLTGAGHSVISAKDGPTAIKLAAGGAIRPEILLTDYNLPGGMTGLEVLSTMRSQLKAKIPAIVLTGDISKNVLAEIQRAECTALSKPVASSDLYAAIRDLAPPTLPQHPPAGTDGAAQTPRIICVVDDSPDIQAAIRSVLEHDGRTVKVYSNAESFLAAHVAGQDQCLIIDTSLPGMSGIDLIEHLRCRGDSLPAILITGQGDVGMAVRAMRAGASDFIEKPVARATLLECIDRAVTPGSDGTGGPATQGEAAAEARRRLDSLTTRQKAVLDLVLAGNPSKNIAADLSVSQRTIENHRAEIMHKLGVRSIPDLVRVVLSASPP